MISLARRSLARSEGQEGGVDLQDGDSVHLLPGCYCLRLEAVVNSGSDTAVSQGRGGGDTGGGDGGKRWLPR